MPKVELNLEDDELKELLRCKVRLPGYFANGSIISSSKTIFINSRQFTLIKCELSQYRSETTHLLIAFIISI